MGNLPPFVVPASRREARVPESSHTPAASRMDYRRGYNEEAADALVEARKDAAAVAVEARVPLETAH